MGQLFGSLTQPGITLHSGQFQTAGQAQNTVPSMPEGGLDQHSTPSTLSKPSYQQASQMGARPGGVNALSPGLTKAGKLATLLSSGLQGALAGRAAQEQMIAQSGGRRSGGAGVGFEAGYNLPWQRAMQQQQIEQAQAQTALTRAQGEMVPTPYGMMPAGIARYILPSEIRGKYGLEGAQARAGATEQAAQTSAGARTQAAQTAAEAARYGADQRVKAAQMNLGPQAAVPQELQDQYQLPSFLPLKFLNTAESAANRPLSTVAGQNDSFVINKQTGAKRALGVGNRAVGAAMARPVQVGDEANPGQTKYMTAGQAISSGAPGAQSASVAVPRTAAKAEVPSKIGDTKLAFNTAIQHADLLTSAVQALNNGDQQTLNSLKNRFKTEFGVAGPISAQAIADAYQREITSVLAKGHITDAEVNSVGKTLNVNRQSPQQSLGVIAAYKSLAQSKMNMLNQQKQSAINQSQPKGGGKVIHYQIQNGVLVPVQ